MKNAKPEADVDKGFASRLRTTLMSLPSASNPVHARPFLRSLAFAAALGVLGVVIIVAVPRAPTTDSTFSFTMVGDEAFGSLSAQTAGRGGGGEESATTTAAGRDGDDTTDSKMIAPGEPYPYETTKYIYNFDGTITLTDEEGTVYRKVSGVSLPSTNLSVNGIDFSKFGNLATQSLSLGNDDYRIYLDGTMGTISISSTENYWDSSGAAFDALSEEEIIAIAADFLSDYGISTSNYGTPRIDTSTMMRILDTSLAGYQEQYVNVSWPLLVNGIEVVNSDGSGYGMSVSVYLPEQLVTSAYIITATAFEGSTYALETDVERIENIIARGGIYGWQPESADTTYSIDVGDPEFVYTTSWSEEGEIFVPALEFSLSAPEGVAYYASAMVIPLAEELLDQSNYPRPYDLMESGSGSSGAAVKADEE